MSFLDDLDVSRRAIMMEVHDFGVRVSTMQAENLSRRRKMRQSEACFKLASFVRRVNQHLGKGYA